MNKKSDWCGRVDRAARVVIKPVTFVHGDVKIMRPGEDGELKLKKKIRRGKLTLAEDRSVWNDGDRLFQGERSTTYTPSRDGLQ